MGFRLVRVRPDRDRELEGEEGHQLRRGQLLGKVVTTFKEQPQLSEGMVQLEQEMIDLLRAELDGWADGYVQREAAHVRRIDMLERRLAKLTKSLETTEQELKRVASMKAVDTGLSSIYRDVQGIDAGDSQRERKKELMADIFEANLALQKGSGS